MQTLHVKELPNFLERFGNFVDGEFRNINIISPTSINLTFSAQDKNRGFDWLSINFEFSAVSDASLLDNSNLAHVDMSDGLIIEIVNKQFRLSIQNSTFFIKSSALKYEEAQF